MDIDNERIENEPQSVSKKVASIILFYSADLKNPARHLNKF
jgi:hypothetical protein